jgi:Domain of unknown function (DUF5753)
VVCALIDQGALNREIGGPAVMRDQLMHLVAMSRRPNITVQIIPDGGPGYRSDLAFSAALAASSPAMSALRPNSNRSSPSAPVMSGATDVSTG